ncbi:DUF3592 domain-containing protein [Limnoglobus roseus]|uniref:DUF3592 domain-containing protein n=1 Tax=Limnoglobus roseus TaxID=2598579 RepID=A0A5C1AGX9_9BACT|nr:DUF3592 domain-containing protein [Limnoglobus roseus]QEL18471.1 hypothetical protein PX52LOC_05496 [Limnoglobus roseus]
MDAYICPLIVLAVVLAFAGLFALSLILEGRKIQALCHDGVEAIAVVVSNSLVVTQHAERRRTVTYRFSDGTGQTRIVVFKSTGGHEGSLAGLAAGDPISIVYLPHNSAVSRPKVVVDDHRAAFRK